jgi:hypothetical protein
MSEKEIHDMQSTPICYRKIKDSPLKSSSSHRQKHKRSRPYQRSQLRRNHRLRRNTSNHKDEDHGYSPENRNRNRNRFSTQDDLEGKVFTELESVFNELGDYMKEISRVIGGYTKKPECQPEDELVEVDGTVD